MLLFLLTGGEYSLNQLATASGLSIEDASALHDKFFATFPALTTYLPPEPKKEDFEEVSPEDLIGKPGEGKSAIIEAAKQTATATAPKAVAKKSTGKSKKVKAAAPTTEQPKPEESATETPSETPDTPPATPTPEGTTSESSPEGNSAA